MEDGTTLRAWFDACRPDLEAAAERWRQATSAALDAAQAAADSMRFASRLYHAQRALDRMHPFLPRRFVELLEATMAERSSGTAASLRSATLPDEMSLVDDDVVNESIEVSRIAARVLADAEWEIREAEQALSPRLGRALGGDRSSPLHPEAFARTVWRLSEVMALNAEERAACLRVAPGAITDFARATYASVVSWCGRADAAAGFVIVRGEASGAVPIPVDVSLDGMAVDGRLALLDATSTVAESASAAPPVLEARDRVFHGVITNIDAILSDFRLTPELRRVLSGLLMALMRFALGSPETLYAPGHRLWAVPRKLESYALGQCLRDRVAHDDFILFGDNTIQALMMIDVKSLSAVDRHLDAMERFVQSRPNQLIEHEKDAMQHFARLEDRRRKVLGVAINRHRERISSAIGATEMPFRLRQFMLADWAEVLARTELSEGRESGEYAEYWRAAQRVVAQMRTRETGERSAESIEDIEALLDVLDRGMAIISVPSVEKHELASAFLRPEARARQEWVDSDFVASPTAAADRPEGGRKRVFWGARDEATGWSQGGPSTTGLTSAVPAGDAEHWINTLRIGSVIELFLLGTWFDARLVSISAAGNLYMFEDEMGGGSHPLTRRALMRLVREGLAGPV